MSDLDHRQLLYLYEVVQTGSVRGAADKLDVNPSSISRRISDLEARLDTPLLVRHGRGSRVTDAGAVLVDHFHAEMRRRELLVAKLEAMRAFREGQVSIAMGESFVVPFMDEVWSRFGRRHPGLSLRLQCGGTNEIVRLVIEDEVQIGVVLNPPRNPLLRSVAKTRRPICVVMPAGHELTRLGRPVSLEEVSRFPVAAKLGTHGIQQAVERAAEEEKVRFTFALRTASGVAILRFVFAGLGVGFMTSRDRDGAGNDGRLAFSEVSSRILSEAETHVVTRASGTMPAASRHLLKLVVDNMRKASTVV